MQVTRNVLNISDLYKRVKDGTLCVNKSYQRSAKLWPMPSRSYFIDTILNEYPFPKITIRQIIDTKSMVSKQEIVDGQQRIDTIVDFLDNSLRLTSTSKKYNGMLYEELADDDKEAFLAYEVSVDTIIRASDEEVLETFRRMNSYMLPLNKPELRYSKYQGCFKWFISNLAEIYMPFFQETGILTLNEINRMKDSELLTECVQVMINGIVNKSDSELDKLYRKYDGNFDCENMYYNRFVECTNYIKDHMYPLYKDGTLTGYMFYSLFSALQYNKYGPANKEDCDPTLSAQGEFCHDPVVAVQTIAEMINEVEIRRQQRRNKEAVDNTTAYALFAQACESSTHRKQQRFGRRHYILKALQS